MEDGSIKYIMPCGFLAYTNQRKLDRGLWSIQIQSNMGVVGKGFNLSHAIRRTPLVPGAK